MKKPLTVLMMLLSVLALAACGAGPEEYDDGGKTVGAVSPTDLEEEQEQDGALVLPRQEDGVGVYYGSGGGLSRMTFLADDAAIGSLSPAGLVFPEYPEDPGLPVLKNPWPVSMGGPLYEISPELQKELEQELREYLTLLCGEYDPEQYPIYYEEYDFSEHLSRIPHVKLDEAVLSAAPGGLSLSLEGGGAELAARLAAGELSQEPLLAAALDYVGVDDPQLEHREEYYLNGQVHEYDYAVWQKTEDSREQTLNREFGSVFVSYLPDGEYLHLSFSRQEYAAVEAGLPAVSLSQALDKVERFFPELDRQQVRARVSYLAHIRDEYLIPCWELYLPTADRAADGTTLYIELWVPTVDTSALPAAAG